MLRLIVPFFHGDLSDVDCVTSSLADVIHPPFHICDPETVIRCRPELKRLYTRQLLCCLASTWDTDPHLSGLESVDVDLHIFRDGHSNFVLSFPRLAIDSNSVCDIVTHVTQTVEDPTSPLTQKLRQVTDRLVRISKVQPEVGQTDRSGEICHIFGFAFPVVYVPGRRLDIDAQDILKTLLFPDFGGQRRVAAHVRTSECLAEDLTLLCAHASWESFVIHGTAAPEELENYLYVNRYLLRVWLQCYVADRLARVYLSDMARVWRQPEPKTAQTIETTLFRIKDLRRRYVEAKTSLLDYDANMDSRFIELLRFSRKYSNLDSLLDGVDQKISLLIDEYSWLHSTLESKRGESLNFRLQVASILLAVFGSIQAADIVFNTLEASGWVLLTGAQKLVIEAAFVSGLTLLLLWLFRK